MDRPRLLLVAVAAILVIAIGAAIALQPAPAPGAPPTTAARPSPSASATASATVAPAAVFASDLGYSIPVRPGWRRSALLSLRAPATSLVLVGQDLFTRRTPEDERATVGGDTGGPAFFWTLVIQVDRNRDGLTLRQWVAEGHVGAAVGQRIEDATIDGRAAINVTAGGSGDVNYLVARGDDVVSIRYNTQGDPPAGATKADLDLMVAGIKLAPTAIARPTAAPAPGPSTVAGIESFPLGTLSGDWTFVLRLRFEGATVQAELWAVEIYGERRLLALRWEEPRSFTRTVLARQLSPDGRRIVLSTPVEPAIGAGYRLTVVDLVTGATRVLADGLSFRAVTPAWSPDGLRVAYVRATDGPNDSALWVVDAAGGQPRGPLANTATVLGWSGDGSRIGYRATDGRYALVEVGSGATLALGTLLQGEDDAVSWRQPTPAFRPVLAAAFSASATGGEQTIAVYETPSSAAQIVVREPQPPDNLSYLREPRWSPSGPILLYRRGIEVYQTGGFVTAGSTPTHVPLEGRVLRAEWAPGNSAGLESIVYVVDGPEGLSRGASVRIALGSGANARTVFVAPAIQGTSDITDIATVRY